MNTPILNRDFRHPTDGWYHIEAKGDHPNSAAGIIQVIDDQAVQGIVNRFNADAAAGALRHGHELLIDHEHFSAQPDQETRAYGWLQQLQNRSDGIYGRIRWTATGRAAVDGGDYRFFSTEYDPADFQIVNSGRPQRARPTRLDGLTLTNMNNNRGQRPITNRDGEAPHRSTYEPGYPQPALETWFQAVGRMYWALNRKARLSGIVSWAESWNLCRQQHPDLFAAAFSPNSSSASADPQAAAQIVSSVANRVRAECGCSFADGWDFMQREAPHIFNRMHQAAPTGRGQEPEPSEDADARIVRGEASRLMRDLALGICKESGCKFDAAWSTVQNREPLLSDLAFGRVSYSEACAQAPELPRRLIRAMFQGARPDFS